MLTLPSMRGLMLYGVVSTTARMLPIMALMGASLVVSPGDFGVLAGVVAAFTLCVGIAEGGLDSAASLLIGGRERPPTVVVASLLTVRVALAGVLAVSVLPALLLPLAPAYDLAMIALAAGALALASVAATCRVKIRASSPKREMGILATDRALSTLPFLAGLGTGAEVAVLALLFLCGQGFGALATIFIAPPPSPGSSLVGELLRQAMPFMVSTGAANVTWRVGVLALGMSGLTEQAGYLAMAIYPVQAIALVSAGSAPLVLISGRRGLNNLRPRRWGVAALVVLTAMASGLVAIVGPQLPVPAGTVAAMAVLLWVLPAALANPLVGAGIRVRGHAHLVAGAALAGAAVATVVSLATTRAPVQALGIVLAEVTVLTVMLWLRPRRPDVGRVGLLS